MSATDEAYADDLGEGLAQLVRIAEQLPRWQALPWLMVQEMARTVGPLILAQLVARDLWSGLTAAEQANVHWTMAEGHTVAGVREAYVQPYREAPRIASLCRAADRAAVRCGAYSYTRTAQGRTSNWAEEITARLDALPQGWRIEAIRRASENCYIVDAIGDAATSLNILRSVHGIDARLA